MQDKNNSLPIADATLSLTNYKADQEKVKIVTRHTGENGIVKNIKFAEEHVKVTATAEGYESWTAEFEFTCKHGSCNKCEMVKIIELPKLEEEEFCENVEGSVKIMDSANNKSLANVTIDVYKIPLECALPDLDSLVSTTTTTSTTISTTQDNSAEDNSVENNSAKDNSAEDNSTEDNSAEDNRVEDNSAEDNSAEDNIVEDNSAEDNSAEGSTTTSTTPTPEPGLRNAYIWNLTNYTSTTPVYEMRTLLLNRNLVPTDMPNCTMVKVVENERTDHEGVAVFPVESNAHYIVKNIRHSEYISTATTGTVNCTEDECDSCKLEMDVNMTKPGCDNATLHIHVRNNYTDDGIYNATVDIFSDGEQLNTEDLFTDSNGKVVYHVKDNGEYSVIVSAPGMIAVEESSKTKCNITACDKCFTLFKFEMPTTEVPPVCDNSTLTTSFLDSVTGKDISEGLSITLGTTSLTDGSQIALALRVPSLTDFPITENGNYTLYITAEGYKPTTRHIVFDCIEDDCGNCSQSINITLKQDFCEETTLKMKIVDQDIPVEGATVTLYSAGSWNISEGSGVTDTTGTVRLDVAGREDFNILIAKKGYEDERTSAEIFCKKGESCEECSHELEVELEEQFCNETVEIVATIMNEEGDPIENAIVTFIAKKTLNGPQNQVIEEPVETDVDGVAQQNIQQFGLYTVNVTAEGYLPESRDITVVNNTACLNETVPLNFTLPKTKEPFCQNSSLTVTVTDLHTGALLANANVTITLEVSFTTIQISTPYKEKRNTILSIL